MTKSNINSSTSGYLFDSFEGISRNFTDVEMLFTSEVNVMAKGPLWLQRECRNLLETNTNKN